MEGIEAEITGRREVGPDTVALDIEAPPGFDASPGQFVQVRASVDGEEVTRHYSVSSPWVDDTVEITVGVDPEGTLSPTLGAATPGDTVEIDGPYGRVYYEGEHRVTVLAAGPGIGAAVGVAERVRSEGGDVVLVFETDALVHERRLARLAAGGARVYVVRDTAAFETTAESVTDGRHVFVYGFDPFVETARAVIDGGDPVATKVENFG